MARSTKVAKETCRSETGRVRPEIDRMRCEAKADCVTVCPYAVFEVRKLTADERKEISFIGQLKLRVHGGQQAFAVRSEDCHACGLCVTACPEKAIKLVKFLASN